MELARQVEAAGASFLSVHGRTQDQKGSGPVSLDTIAQIKDALSIPVVANGDIKSLEDATKVKDCTRVDGEYLLPLYSFMVLAKYLLPPLSSIHSSLLSNHNSIL